MSNVPASGCYALKPPAVPALTPRIPKLVTVIMLGCGCSTLPAQSAISFAGAQSTMATSISSSGGLPTGIAVDKAGDVFIANTGAGTVVEVPASGGAPITVASGLTTPTGVAVDGSGNVYIVDPTLAYVLEIPAGGGQTQVGSGLSNPQGIAVDASGDVFVANTGADTVVEFPAGGGAPITVASAANGLVTPMGVAVDGSGDVFIADTGLTYVMEIPPGGQSQIGSGLSSPTGVALDAAGDVYVANTGGFTVVEVLAGSGTQIVIPASGLASVLGVGVDGKGDVFIADTRTDSQVVEVQTVSVNFGRVSVGSSSTMTLIYNINSAVNIGPAKVVTQGIPNPDFSASGGSTCIGSLTSPATCSVPASFAPTAPGARMGAVEILDSSSTLQATTLVHGIGVAPQVAFGSAAQITVANGTTLSGLAVDAAGDVFIAQTSGNAILEVPAGGVQTTLATGLNAPNGVAVDGAGNLFVSNGGNASISETPAAGGAPIPYFTAGLLTPAGLALDGSGDVFIADTSLTSVLEVPSTGGAPVLIGNGSFLSPSGVAVDGLGDVFVADTQNGRVVEVPAGGGSPANVATSVFPTAIAVDAAGDVFVSENSNNDVIEVPTGCSTCGVTVASILQPAGVALDAAGDVFIATPNQIVELQASQAPALALSAIAMGTTSSPQTVTLQNIGNAPLAFSAISISAGGTFATDPGTTTCSTSSPVSPGGFCNVGVVCTPSVGGPLSGSLTLTDNALNGSATTQSVSLTCALAQAISFTTAPPATATYGANFTVAATGGATGNPVVFSSAGACTNSGAMYTMTSGTGSCSIIASQAGNGIYAPAQVTLNTTAALATDTVTFTVNAPATAAYLTTFTVAATGGGSSNPIIYQSYGSCQNSGSTYSMTYGAGSCWVTAFQFGDANYASGSATEMTAAALASQAITFTTNAPASAVYGSTFLVAATGGGSDRPVVFTSSGACTNNGNNGAIFTMTSGTGTCSVIANQGASALHLYSAAPTVTELTTATTAAQTITFTTNGPASAAYGTHFTVAAQSSSGLAVSFNSAGACSNAGPVYTMTSATGTCSVIATQAGNTNYSAATQVTESTTAAKASQTIAFTTNPPSTATYGTSFTVAASASSGLAVAYTSSGGCSNVGATYTMTSGTSTCSVIVNQAGNTNYLAATQVTKSATAQKAAASVSISNIPANAVTGGSFTPAYTLTGNGTPTVTSSTTTTCTVSSRTVSYRAAGNCTLTASVPATSNYLAATGPAQSFTIIAAPTLSSLSSTTGLRGTSFTMTLTGTSLTGATAVVVSGTGVTVTNVVPQGATTVTATFTIATNATVSSRTVSVTTPIGSTNTLSFAVTGPTLTSISPNTGTHGTTVPVTLTGTNLTGATGITVSGSGITVTGFSAQSSTTVKANFVIASGASLTSRTVNVITPIGTTTGTVTFTIK